MQENMMQDNSSVPPTIQPEDADRSAASSDLEALRGECEALRQELSTGKDRYLRVLADMENLRRRVDREKADLAQYGQEKIMNDLIPVLDSVENALNDAKGKKEVSIESLIAGFELTKKQLVDALARHGLSQVESEGAKFDPNIHQAIQRIESDTATEDRVSQVFVKGYTLHGRLVRAAMVSVEVPKDN